MHADGHRFGKTKWRAVAKGRTKGRKKENGKKEERERESLAGRADRNSHKIDFPLCLAARAASCASSPNFVANLRATKSAPFDFTLIRCRCRVVDEANLLIPSSRARDTGRRGFHFPRSVPSSILSVSQPSLCFKVTTFLLSSPRIFLYSLARPIVPVFLCVPSFPPLSSSLLYIPVFSLLFCSLYLDLVSRNSALTSIRGRSRR